MLLIPFEAVETAGHSYGERVMHLLIARRVRLYGEAKKRVAEYCCRFFPVAPHPFDESALFAESKLQSEVVQETGSEIEILRKIGQQYSSAVFDHPQAGDFIEEFLLSAGYGTEQGVRLAQSLISADRRRKRK